MILRFWFTKSKNSCGWDSFRTVFSNPWLFSVCGKLNIPASVCACVQTDTNNKWAGIILWLPELSQDISFTHLHFTSEFAEGDSLIDPSQGLEASFIIKADWQVYFLNRWFWNNKAINNCLIIIAILN